jgi:hypothetical protein
MAEDAEAAGESIRRLIARLGSTAAPPDDTAQDSDRRAAEPPGLR